MSTAKRKITKSFAIKLVKDFIETCKQEHIVFDKVILFGSASRNQATEWSDIDVAFVSKIFKHHPIEDRRILNRIILRKDKFLDIESHPYPTKYFKEGDPFIDEIKKTGIEIKA